jgi:phosphomannomutase
MARIRREGKQLSDLIEKLPLPVQSTEVRIGIKDPRFKEYGEKVITDLGLWAANRNGWELAPDNYEGLRVQCDKPFRKGWFLLRLSLHDPVLPLNIEAEEQGAVEEIASELEKFFSNYDKLDLLGFRDLINK